MNRWIVLPIIIPLLTAVAALLAHRSRETQRWISLGGAAALFAAAVSLLEEVSRRGIVVTQAGDWAAPYGITLVADIFSAIMVTLAGLIGLSVALYSLASVDPERETFGFHPLYHFLLMGVCGAFLTGDIFNLYVWFEVMLTASFVLLALGNERPQLEGAIKYLTLNLFSSALFLTAVGILYGLAGTLNMADLSRKLSAVGNSNVPVELTAVALLFLIAFSIKAAAFPLFFWLPASYHTPPVAVTAVFSGLLTKVGVYALIRLFTVVFVREAAVLQSLILVAAGFTMVTGVLGAVAQYEFRRLLSFHIISQIGYPLMGLGLLTPAGLGAAIYFTFHVSVAKAALFLVSGVAHRTEGTFDLKKLGGLYRSQPALAALFFVAAMALAGVPPLSGFFGKLGLVWAGLSVGQYAIVGVALGVSLLTLFSMIKIWNEAFWKLAPDNPDPANAKKVMGSRERCFLFIPIVVLTAVTVILGLFAEPFMALALRAGKQLIDPAGYIRAVLGDP